MKDFRLFKKLITCKNDKIVSRFRTNNFELISKFAMFVSPFENIISHTLLIIECISFETFDSLMFDFSCWFECGQWTSSRSKPNKHIPQYLLQYFIFKFYLCNFLNKLILREKISQIHSSLNSIPQKILPTFYFDSCWKVISFWIFIYIWKINEFFVNQVSSSKNPWGQF